MITMILGASGSGKSLFAEGYAQQVHKRKQEQGIFSNLFYIATMMPYGEETQKKIERHKLQREGKHFYVVEQYKDIEKSFDGSIVKGIVENIEEGTVLLECLSNLVANELYDEKRKDIWKKGNEKEQGYAWASKIADKMIDGIQELERQCGHLIIVTNDVFREGFGAWEGTKEYLYCLGKINKEMAKKAVDIYEVVAGIPVCMKKNQELPFCNTTSFHSNSIHLEKAIEEEKNMTKKVVVLGGAFQGKKDWIKKQWNIEKEESDWKIIEHIEDWIKKEIMDIYQKCLQENKEIEEQGICECIWKKMDKKWIKEENCIYIINEIGSGMVPMGKEERLYRETVGRITCNMAKKADEVYRIVAGYPLRIK